MNRKQTIIYDLACQEMDIYLKRGHLQAKRDEYMGVSSMSAAYQELLETLHAYQLESRENCGYDYAALFRLFKDHVGSLRDLSNRIGEDELITDEGQDFSFFNSLYEDIIGIENRNTLWYRSNEATVVRRQEA
jgi:hypothetical protein